MIIPYRKAGETIEKAIVRWNNFGLVGWEICGTIDSSVLILKRLIRKD